MAVIVSSAPAVPSAVPAGRCESFKKGVRGLYNRIVTYSPLISDITGVVSNVANAQAFSYLLTFIYDTTAATNEGWRGRESVYKILKNVKLLAGASIPFALYAIMKDGRELIAGTEKVDAALRTAENLSWLGDSSSSLITGLEVTGNIAEGASITVAFPISIASFFLATATIALNSRRLYQGRQLIKEMNATMKAGGNTAVLDLLLNKDEYFLNKNFNVEGDHLKKELTEISQLAKKQLDSGKEKECEETLDCAHRCLRGRIRKKNHSHWIAIASSIITLVGMALLLFSPFALCAFTLLAAGAAFSVVKFIYERRAIKHFETTLQQIKDTASLSLK